MAGDWEKNHGEMVRCGKYRRLYRYLCDLPLREWMTSFAEIEVVLGFALPASARLHRPWWANKNRGSGHSQALAWTLAGWETAEVDLDAETLLLRRKLSEVSPRTEFDQMWPVHSAGSWPEGLTISREGMYR